MLDKLSGRLKWRYTDTGIFVEIPSRRGGMTYLYGPVVGIWLIAAAIRYRHLLSAHPVENTGLILQLIAIGIYAFGFVFALCWLLWTFTNDTTLTIDPIDMKIQRRVLGHEVASRTFRTRDVHGLRFVAPRGSFASEPEIDLKTSRIQFQTLNATHVLAVGVTESESLALLTSMHRIHKFPDYFHIEVALTRLEL
jgi:hypothetical protein